MKTVAPGHLEVSLTKRMYDTAGVRAVILLLEQEQVVVSVSCRLQGRT